MATESAHSVLVVDDHDLIRLGLVRAFERSPDFQIVGQAETLAEAIALSRTHNPDVVVTDLRLPDGSGLELVRSLRVQRPDIGLVVLTMYAGDDQLFEAMHAGASAFVGKNAPADHVVVAARQSTVAPRSFTASNLAEAMQRRKNGGHQRLTQRELEVLHLLAQGYGVASIAAKLYVSESTAKSHISKIYEKFGAANRAQAIMAGVRAGLIPEE